jgi:maltooligosyltrehalose trehalohydrolase
MPAEAGTHTSLGARLVAPNRCQFRVWSPQREQIELHIVTPKDRRLPMRKTASGYHEATIDTAAGTRYFFVIDGQDRPDPASRYQPEGVHGPSEVIDDAFAWHDKQWKGTALEEYVIYELHVGTFTPDGTFDAIIPKLDALKELGVTAVELMPIAQFPGARNWGYDGTYISAAQNSYGGPVALKRLVDAAHARGLAIVLDVVYNHLGPEGNYLGQYGPYFTDRYKTAWGSALNFDGPYSDDVRWFFIHNALMWIDEFHIDALRVDAVHAIIDHSAEPFLQDLTTAVRERAGALGRRVYSIAESDLNDPRVITPKEQLGLGFDSQWSDDFHHSLHALLTGERAGYYVGFGKTSDLARVLSTGYLFTGQYSEYRGRKYGLKPNTTDGAKFVVSSQNHDQIGNRMLGERLSALVSNEKLRVAAAAVILSPFLPLIFMGEEYGEKAPFQYFTSHSDSDLIEAVRRGRREEFDDFDWKGEPPDPHDVETFLRSRLTWKEDGALRNLYRQLLRLRRETPALRSLDLASVETHPDDERRTLLVRRDNVLLAFNFGDRSQTVELPPGRWRPLIESAAKIEGNRVTLPAESFAVFGASSEQRAASSERGPASRSPRAAR